MGDLLQFPVHRTARPAGPAAPPAFYFDVTDPMSYLVAERVERRLGEVEWIVVDGDALSDVPAARSERRPSTEAHARALRLPLVWPDTVPVSAPCALRATAFACELGAGSPFALALSRLAFCGGFTLDDPETLAEAAAAAAVPLGACLEAAGEDWRDEELRELACELRAAGVRSLPTFRVDGRWLSGEPGLEAASALLATPQRASRPLAPAGA